MPNLIGTAMKEKSEQTAEGIQLLGDMMRFMLHEYNQDFIQVGRHEKRYMVYKKYYTKIRAVGF